MFPLTVPSRLKLGENNFFFKAVKENPDAVVCKTFQRALVNRCKF